MLRCKTLPYEGKEGYIFISYSHKDSARVFPVIERLDAEGYRVWFDEGIDPGSEWPENVASHLNDSAVYLCFVSENFLASQNCRRELNFALRKEIAFLSVFLEDVTMPLGVEMQITANQAVFKHKIPEEEDFYRKLLAAKTLEPARRPPAPAPAEEPVPAPAGIPAPEKEEPPAPVKEETSGEKEPKPEKTVKEKKTKAEKPAKEKKPLKKAVVIIAAVLAGLLALLILPGVISAVRSAKQTAATKYLTGIDNKTVLQNAARFLYGDRVCEGETAENFVKGIDYEDYRADVALKDAATGKQTAYNLSTLPYAVSFAPGHKNALLRFYDRAGGEYRVEGAPGTNPADGALVFSAPEKAEYDNSFLLADGLKYEFSFSAKKLRLTETGSKRGKTYVCEAPALAGALSEGSEALREIAAIAVPDLTENAGLELRFTDGGHAVKPIVKGGSFTSNYAYFAWSSEVRLYNGALTELNNTGSVLFDFVNTSPYGFIAVKDGNLYFYQMPLETAPENETPADGQNGQ